MGNKFERLKLALIASAWLAAPVIAEAGAITDYSFANASAVLNGQPVTISGLVTDSFIGELSASVQLSNGLALFTTLPCRLPRPAFRRRPIHSPSAVWSFTMPTIYR